ncbi:MAG: hypothetical protein AB1540_10495 [Bdellovibrionota bacterium]
MRSITRALLPMATLTASIFFIGCDSDPLLAPTLGNADYCILNGQPARRNSTGGATECRRSGEGIDSAFEQCAQSAIAPCAELEVAPPGPFTVVELSEIDNQLQQLADVRADSGNQIVEKGDPKKNQASSLASASNDKRFSSKKSQQNDPHRRSGVGDAKGSTQNRFADGSSGQSDASKEAANFANQKDGFGSDFENKNSGQAKKDEANASTEESRKLAGSGGPGRFVASNSEPSGGLGYGSFDSSAPVSISAGTETIDYFKRAGKLTLFEVVNKRYDKWGRTLNPKN